MSFKKTICFIIFSVGKANGGHYRSLTDISKALRSEFNVFIITIGYSHSKTIQNSSINNYFVYFNVLNFVSTLKMIHRIFKNINVDIIHCFDYQSFFIGKILSNKYKIPLLYTICGGQSPKGFFPYINNLTVFSKENFDYFKKHNKYSRLKIWLIPNRVESFQVNTLKIISLKNKYKLHDKVVFLRICRISVFYKKSLLQSINLVKTLKDKGFNVSLLIVGNIQDKKVYTEVKKLIRDIDEIFIETNDLFTLNAKELIDISTFVIGTGRSFMEACSRGKIMLAPAKVGNFPILIDNSNFEIAFYKNFSERIDFTNNSIQNSMIKIERLLKNKITIDFESKKSLERFKDYFFVNNGVPLYINVYNDITFNKSSFHNLFFHYLFVLKNNFGNFYRNIFSNIINK